jgi:flagellin-like protein
MRLVLNRIRGLWRDERGITGLETSIMLIAFVVVASVFAFAVLRMGIFSSERTAETVTKGIVEITSLLALRGPVVAHGEDLPTGGYTHSIRFQVRHQEDPVELSDNAIVVNIQLGDSCIPLQFGDSGPNPGLSWTVDWINGPGPVLNGINSPAEIILTLYGLRDKLTATGEFAMAIKPRDALPEPCIPPNLGDSSMVLLAGNVDLGQGELQDDDSKVEFGLDYYDKTSSDGGVTPNVGLQKGRYVTHLTFLVHNSAPSGSIDLSGESTVVSYSDSTQTFSDLPFLEDIANSQIGVGWGILGDSGPEIGSGERADIQVNLFGLEDLLGPGDKFSVEVRPLVGSPLIIEDKQVPSELNPGTNRLD